jgi:hypothetical protein
MTYRSGSVERTAGAPPIAAEVIALQGLSALGHDRNYSCPSTLRDNVADQTLRLLGDPHDEARFAR